MQQSLDYPFLRWVFTPTMEFWYSFKMTYGKIYHLAFFFEANHKIGFPEGAD